MIHSHENTDTERRTRTWNLELGTWNFHVPGSKFRDDTLMRIFVGCRRSM